MVPDKEYRSLQGKKIVITRPLEQTDEFAGHISALGGEPIKFPVISIDPPDSWDAADYAIKNLKQYSWIIFTSVNGVHSFIKRMEELKIDIKRSKKGLKICTVGIKTADAVEQYELQVDFVPEEFRAEAIVEGFRKIRMVKGKILIPRAQVGREILPEELIKMGLKVDVVPVYKVVRPDIDVSWFKGILNKKEIDVVTFTSGSCVRNFIEILGTKEYKILLNGVKIACISPVTADTVRKYGIEVDIIPERYTVEDLTEAIANYYKDNKVLG